MFNVVISTKKIKFRHSFILKKTEMLSIFGRNINKCFVEFKRQNKITRPKIHQML